MAIIRVLVSVALFAIAVIVILDNLGRQRHRAGRRPGHRRHRHRPRRPGHFLRPVRGARDPVRQAVQARRHDPLRQQHRHGRAHRPQDHAAALAHRRAADHGQHQVARARDPQPRRRRRRGGSRSISPSAARLRQNRSTRSRQLAATAVEARKGCKLVRCALVRRRRASLDYELVYDDRDASIRTRSPPTARRSCAR